MSFLEQIFRKKAFTSIKNKVHFRLKKKSRKVCIHYNSCSQEEENTQYTKEEINYKL